MIEPHTAPLASSRRPSDPDDRPELGVVLTGGGARAAYQVGLLRFLARRFPDLDIAILSGVSAGAINAAHLASHHGTFAQAVEELVGLWQNLRVQDVFRTDSRSLVMNLLSWGLHLVSGGIRAGPRIRGLVDTQPLREYLCDVLHCVDEELTGVRYNLERRRLRAVGLSTSNYTTGQSVTWIQGTDDVEEWTRPRRLGRNTTLTVEHVMASCALPLFFPAVRLESGWYGDGGIRLSAPLSPALHMGAERILVMSTRYRESQKEADRPVVEGYPPPAQVMSQLVNSVFLDVLDQDAQRLELVNQLLRKLPEEEREGLRIVDSMTLRPSRDLGKLAGGYEPQLPWLFRWLTRGLGTRETESPDALSMVMFQPEYLSELIEIGERDAEARSDELVAFVEGASRRSARTATG
ncbi:MAG: patatin-like phospholipase family protein [Longimicrobiales bacterium]|nr:patatin-like phospholipase family protein [Longimicrobiales bacterium]